MILKLRQHEKETAPADWKDPAEFEDEMELSLITQFGLIVHEIKAKNAGVYSAEELQTIIKACDLLDIDCDVESNGSKVE